MTIALTGVTGSIGGRVAQALSDLDPILLVRRPEALADVDPGRVRPCDYGKPEQVAAGLAGIDTLLLVSAHEGRDRVAQHEAVVQAAADAGVRHVVYTSFVGAAPDATFTLGRDHGATEKAIRDAGLQFTFLRDNFYLDVLPEFADDAGVIRGPAGQGKVAAVARADVADVASVVLRDPAAHRDAIYQLTGPEALTMAEVARRAGAVLGRQLRFEDESEEAAYRWRREEYGAEQWQLDAWVSTYTAIRDGAMQEVSSDVHAITGHAARDLETTLSPDSNVE